MYSIRNGKERRTSEIQFPSNYFFTVKWIIEQISKGFNSINERNRRLSLSANSHLTSTDDRLGKNIYSELDLTRTR